MIGREVLRQALLSLDRIDETGNVELSASADYENKAVPLLNQYIAELSNAERRSGRVLVRSLEEEIALEEDTINRCLVPALAFNLAFMDNDMTNYQLYQAMYERNREHIILSEESVVDEINMTGGMV